MVILGIFHQLYNVAPAFSIAKLVNISPMIMVYCTQVTIVLMGFINKLITGGHHIVIKVSHLMVSVEHSGARNGGKSCETRSQLPYSAQAQRVTIKLFVLSTWVCYVTHQVSWLSWFLHNSSNWRVDDRYIEHKPTNDNKPYLGGHHPVGLPSWNHQLVRVDWLLRQSWMARN